MTLLQTTSYIVFLNVFYISRSSEQNTLGLLSYDITRSYQDFTLIYPHHQPNVYLLNNCGEIMYTFHNEEVLDTKVYDLLENVRLN